MILYLDGIFEKSCGRLLCLILILKLYDHIIKLFLVRVNDNQAKLTSSFYLLSWILNIATFNWSNASRIIACLIL